MKFNDCIVPLVPNLALSQMLAGRYSLSQSVAVKGSMLTVCASGGSRCKLTPTYCVRISPKPILFHLPNHLPSSSRFRCRTYLHPLTQPHQPRKCRVHLHRLLRPLRSIPPRPALPPLTSHTRPSEEHAPLHATSALFALLAISRRIGRLLLPP